jgi:hypothetical protein
MSDKKMKGESEYQSEGNPFKDFVRRIVSVPKADIDAAEAKYQAQKKAPAPRKPKAAKGAQA